MAISLNYFNFVSEKYFFFLVDGSKNNNTHVSPSLRSDRTSQSRIIQLWSDQSDPAPRHCFSTMKWCVFQNNNTDREIRIPGLTGKSMPNLKHRSTPIAQVIWRSTGNPGMHSGELLAVLRNNTRKKWGQTTKSPTPETCGLD